MYREALPGRAQQDSNIRVGSFLDGLTPYTRELGLGLGQAVKLPSRETGCSPVRVTQPGFQVARRHLSASP